MNELAAYTGWEGYNGQASVFYLKFASISCANYPRVSSNTSTGEGAAIVYHWRLRAVTLTNMND
jgi:hypothetical protein